MGIAKQRRLRKAARRLNDLAKEDGELFEKVWDRRIGGWLREMHTVARNENGSVSMVNGRGTSTDPNRFKVTVSGICRQADSLIRACGTNVEKIVGQRTRDLLDAEAASLIARLYEPRLFRLVAYNQYSIKNKPA